MMSYPTILSREEISRQANSAAMRSAATGRCEANPYAPGTDAAKDWETAFDRYLSLHSCPDAEGSA